jgi:YggT family protein
MFDSLLKIILMLLNVAWFFVIAHVILSWLVVFQVLNLRQPIVAQIWEGLNRLLEPIYARVRRFLPNMGQIDLAPLAVLLAIFALQILVQDQLYR